MIITPFQTGVGFLNLASVSRGIEELKKATLSVLTTKGDRNER
jgi:hypothetical protein